MKKVKWTYNVEEDILYLSVPKRKVKHSLNFRDIFIIDFDENDNVIGLEILDASEVVYGFSKNMLKNIKDARIGAKYHPNMIVVGFIIKSETVEKPIESSVAIPISSSKR